MDIKSVKRKCLSEPDNLFNYELLGNLIERLGVKFKQNKLKKNELVLVEGLPAYVHSSGQKKTILKFYHRWPNLESFNDFPRIGKSYKTKELKNIFIFPLSEIDGSYDPNPKNSWSYFATSAVTPCEIILQFLMKYYKYRFKKIPKLEAMAREPMWLSNKDHHSNVLRAIKAYLFLNHSNVLKEEVGRKPKLLSDAELYQANKVKFKNLTI